MAENPNIEVYLEIGKSRTFAAAIEWPGWCRSGRDEALALQAMLEYGSRYARVLQTTALEFHAPSSVSELIVVERVAGNATTDFGAPGIVLSRDADATVQTELERWQEILKACWRAFDVSVQAATGLALSTGPRGGGRDLTKIVEHVRDADAAYLSKLGGMLKLSDADTLGDTLEQIRAAIPTTLIAAVYGQVPAQGPRGGLRWPPRYFVRRLAWHELDHAWEIEDRMRPAETAG